MAPRRRSDGGAGEQDGLDAPIGPRQRRLDVLDQRIGVVCPSARLVAPVG